MAAGGDRDALELYLPPTRSSVGRARAAVDGLPALGPHPDARFALKLLVSELVANAVRHGAGAGDPDRVRLAVRTDSGLVRAEVGDRGGGFDPERVSMPGVEAESGRGLAFLDALSSRWGVSRDGERCIWFEIDLE